jgi:hypothetical protein
MSDGGDIEVESSALVDVLPKDVVKEVGNVKLFNKWDYDVEVRDISLTYVEEDKNYFSAWISVLTVELMETVTTSLCGTPSTSLTPPVAMPSSDSARPTAPSLSG